ncbi:MAG: outer membrane lipid asymmetry maintenance protein MlaD [Deltaproteobacteria bacterium]|jgi:phospholipid/cholesterol/gamma-HCH transport system substrate-binding protein|nr:outer membrane lipid asymmetry maintenance protein MlaD [Deltaproteobacteria bacterium]MCK5420752.1 outer membrane lipid asymmetry maintenance protein MlaD [Deltaproteobacteria bacterium]
MRKIDLELIVGLFIMVGIIALCYISVKLGKMEWVGGSGYQVTAVFPKLGGLKVGALVEIAGIEVGRVKSLSLDDNYQARVVLDINKDVKLQDDSIASIKTKGLLGEKYVDILPGGEDEIIKDGGKIQDTVSPIDLEELIAKYIFGKV